MFGVAWGANQFSSLLLAYRLHAGISQSTADALFGVYALGLIPALLVLGPVSDARGRRAIVAAAGLLSVLASLVLIAGEHTVALLYLGRFLAGVCSGAAFAAGTARSRSCRSRRMTRVPASRPAPAARPSRCRAGSGSARWSPAWSRSGRRIR